jgi:hypothetical protein
MSKRTANLLEFDVANPNTTSTTSYYFTGPEIVQSVTTSIIGAAALPAINLPPSRIEAVDIVDDSIISFTNPSRTETVIVPRGTLISVPSDYNPEIDNGRVVSSPNVSIPISIPISIPQLPPNFARVPQKVISIVLERYRAKLLDSASNESFFFSELNKFKNTDEEKLLFTMIYTKLYREEFKLEEYFDYILKDNLQINYDSIFNYIRNIDIFRVTNMREKIFNGQFPNFGNIYTFFSISILNNKDNELMYNNILENDNILSNEDSYLLNPVIKYYSQDSYSNYRKAEEDYWEIVEDFYTSLGFTLTASKTKFSFYTSQFNSIYSRVILDSLLNKNNESKVYGVPLLLSKKSTKSDYSPFKYEDEEIKKILKQSYKRITKDEFYNFLNKLVVELVEYYAITKEPIDYTNLSDLPDIENYIRLKLNFFNLSTTKNKITVNMLKEMKFYRYFFAKFFNITNSDLFQFMVTIENEFNNLRNLILDLRQKLINEGNFIQ